MDLTKDPGQTVHNDLPTAGLPTVLPYNISILSMHLSTLHLSAFGLAVLAGFARLRLDYLGDMGRYQRGHLISLQALTFPL